MEEDDLAEDAKKKARKKTRPPQKQKGVSKKRGVARGLERYPEVSGLETKKVSWGRDEEIMGDP